MKKSDWLILALALAVALASKVAWCQEAEYQAAEESNLDTLVGGVLVCRWASIHAQLESATPEQRQGPKGLDQQSIEAGYCVESEPGRLVQLREDGVRKNAPGILDSASSVMFVYPEEWEGKTEVEGWWIARDHLASATENES